MKTLIYLLLCLVVASPLMAQQPLTDQRQREFNISRKLVNDKRNTALAYNMSQGRAPDADREPHGFSD